MVHVVLCPARCTDQPLRLVQPPCKVGIVSILETENRGVQNVLVSCPKFHVGTKIPTQVKPKHLFEALCYLANGYLEKAHANKGWEAVLAWGEQGWLPAAGGIGAAPAWLLSKRGGGAWGLHGSQGPAPEALSGPAGWRSGSL